MKMIQKSTGTLSPIPERIRVARKRAMLTQKELGIKIGMDIGSASSRVNHYEKGRHTPDIKTLRLMAKELYVPLSANKLFFAPTHHKRKGFVSVLKAR